MTALVLENKLLNIQFAKYYTGKNNNDKKIPT